LFTAGLIVIGLSLSACTKKPSEEKCEEFADHFVKLLAESRDKPDARIRKLAQNQHQDLVNACVQDGSAKQVDCVLAQTSVLDVEANCK
jgi:LipL41-expression chaperone Lep